MKRSTAEQRFWRSVDKDTPYGPAGECWRWTAAVDATGHGRFRWSGKQGSAHRYSYALHCDEIPVGARPHDVCVLHTCDMRDCVNPRHLYLGDQLQNSADRYAREHQQFWKRFRFARDRPLPRDPSPITPELVEAIRSDNRPQSAIAADMGVAQATISNIKTRKTWAHVN